MPEWLVIALAVVGGIVLAVAAVLVLVERLARGLPGFWLL